MSAGNITGVKGVFDLINVNRCNKHIVRNSRQDAICEEESAWLYIHWQGQYPSDDRRKQVQVVDHANHDEKYA